MEEGRERDEEVDEGHGAETIAKLLPWEAMRVGITIGDPAGIGPELVERVLAELPPSPGSERIVYGDRAVLEECARRAGRSLQLGASLVEVTRLAAVTPGQPSVESGRAQVAYLECAVAEVRAGRLDALVTAPISKAWARKAGFAFDGHTDFLAARLASDEKQPLPVTMFFAGPRLRVALATVHVPLAEVPRRLKCAPLCTTIAQGPPRAHCATGSEFHGPELPSPRSIRTLARRAISVTRRRA